jgi:hypothetical protein
MSQEKPRPLKSSKCAVVIPTHKIDFSPNEKVCIDVSASTLSAWDLYFAVPEGLDIEAYADRYQARNVFFPKERFSNPLNYNQWMLGPELYEAFAGYEFILICQPDAIVVRDDLQFWVDREWSYIGAPWTQKIIFKPNFHNKPHLSGAEFHLEVGNGGLSLRRIEHTLSLLSRYQLIISEFSEPFEDAMFALLGVIDRDFKIAPFWEAARFSMEINARQIVESIGMHPMGFHNLYAYDKAFWREIVEVYLSPSSELLNDSFYSFFS